MRLLVDFIKKSLRQPLQDLLGLVERLKRPRAPAHGVLLLGALSQHPGLFDRGVHRDLDRRRHLQLVQQVRVLVFVLRVLRGVLLVFVGLERHPVVDVRALPGPDLRVHLGLQIVQFQLLQLHEVVEFGLSRRDVEFKLVLVGVGLLELDWESERVDVFLGEGELELRGKLLFSQRGVLLGFLPVLVHQFFHLFAGFHSGQEKLELFQPFSHAVFNHDFGRGDQEYVEVLKLNRGGILVFAFFNCRSCRNSR